MVVQISEHLIAIGVVAQLPVGETSDDLVDQRSVFGVDIGEAAPLAVRAVAREQDRVVRVRRQSSSTGAVDQIGDVDVFEPPFQRLDSFKTEPIVL